MSIHDLHAQRLYVDADLYADALIVCDKDQTNYLKNVLRLKTDDQLLVFNGRSGEWRAQVTIIAKKSMQLVAKEQIRAQQSGPDIDYLFAPLKRARLDFVVQKAVEMGVRRLRPILTQHTVAGRVKMERMRANVIEAAEQCGILHVPQVLEPRRLSDVIANWSQETAEPSEFSEQNERNEKSERGAQSEAEPNEAGPKARRLIFCDEGAGQANPLDVLQALPAGPVAVLIGPEGGFSSQERQMLLDKPFVSVISIGPRIMRADTAAVAALALINVTLGDWQ